MGNSSYFSLHRDYFNSLTLSNVGELSSWVEFLIIISTSEKKFRRSLYTPSLTFSRRGRAVTANKCTKQKVYCTCILIALRIGPNQTFSLLSLSSDLKVP